MWNDIGRKLQNLAKVLCWVGIIASLIWAGILLSMNDKSHPTILSGILTAVIGCLSSWIGSWAIYGLGLVTEYVENGGSKSGNTSHGIQTSDGGVIATAGSYWICPKCKNRNPMSKVECKECGTIR